MLMERGDRGPDVASLKQALVDQGYNIGVDQDFGEGTETAVKDFQTKLGVQADGKVRDDTWQALGLAVRLDGIDIYSENSIPPASTLVAHDISFVYQKASQYAADTTVFPARRAEFQSVALINGAYHFYNNDHSVADQTQLLTTAVKRLPPGEISPSFDFEHSSQVVKHDDGTAWTDAEWLDPLDAFMDTIETAFGRTPAIYTSANVWQEFLDNSLLFDRYEHYPLWVKYYFFTGRYESRLTAKPALPAAWANWTYWQYSDQPAGKFAPVLAAGVDMNVFNGTIHQLRGLADLGRPAPFELGNTHQVISTDQDGDFWLQDSAGARGLLTVQGWMPNQILAAAGDPAVAVWDSQVYVVFRDHRGLIDELVPAADGSSVWNAATITGNFGGEIAVSDPAMVTDANSRHIVYWGNDDHLYHLWFGDGRWNVYDLTNETGAPALSGSPQVYWWGEAAHAISRAGLDGHLYDFWYDGTWKSQDLTADSKTPAATYKPTAYTLPGGAPQVVLRALRGEIYQIARDTLAVEKLSWKTGAPVAAGSLDAIVANGEPHSVYRGVDSHIYDLYQRNGKWQFADVSKTVLAAADPKAGASGNSAYVYFCGVDGKINQVALP